MISRSIHVSYARSLLGPQYIFGHISLRIHMIKLFNVCLKYTSLFNAVFGKISFMCFEKRIAGVTILNVYHGKRRAHLDRPGI
jgi:hypothetical protein